MNGNEWLEGIYEGDDDEADDELEGGSYNVEGVTEEVGAEVDDVEVD